MWHYGYGMPGVGWLGWLPGLLILILIAIAVVFLVRMLDVRVERGRGRGGAPEPPARDLHGPATESARDLGDDPALRILRERYARGEIDREEFQQRQRDLGGD